MGRRIIIKNFFLLLIFWLRYDIVLVTTKNQTKGGTK